MKQLILFLIANIILTNANAQSNIPIPEFKNTIIQVDSAQKVFKKLEKISAEMDFKIKWLGYGGVDFYLSIAGNKSSIILQPQQAIFVVKLPDSETDPTNYVELYKFESDSDRRRMKTNSRKLFGKLRNVNIPKVELTFLKISSACYLITISPSLQKGNYGFNLDPSLSASGLTRGSNLSANIFAFDIN